LGGGSWKLAVREGFPEHDATGAQGAFTRKKQISRRRVNARDSIKVSNARARQARFLDGGIACGARPQVKSLKLQTSFRLLGKV
jgi:hypothetical protein